MEGLPASLAAAPSATDVRVASAAGGKALVTWWETTKSKDGPPIDATYAQVWTGSLAPRIEIDKVDLGDEFISGAVPIAEGSELSTLQCFYAAPSGRYGCTKAPPGGKKAALFTFAGISSGGPSRSAIGAAARGADAALFVPGGRTGEVLAFSTRASAGKTSYPFAAAGDEPPYADGLVGVMTADDEAAVVYRFKDAIYGRRLGFDQKWRGPAVMLSEKGRLVGAPAAIAMGPRVVAVFSQRAKATDPWRIVRADWSPGAAPTRADVNTGAAQAQGPGLAASAPDCALLSWVDGTGKTTATKVARLCQELGPALTLTGEGVEGGRAYLGTDVAVWQEIPAGKPAVFRVANVACR